MGVLEVEVYKLNSGVPKCLGDGEDFYRNTQKVNVFSLVQSGRFIVSLLVMLRSVYSPLIVFSLPPRDLF